MNKFICNLNTKEYVIEKIDSVYKYNSLILDDEEVYRFISNIIKMCRGIEKKKSIKTNNKIEIYYDDSIITLTGIDSRVIKYINSFLK